MNKWQPIETAPKDETLVDLWCRRSWNPPDKYERCCDMYWCTTHKIYRSVKNRHYVERLWDPRRGGPHLIPTHWRPLPEPPEG